MLACSRRTGLPCYFDVVLAEQDLQREAAWPQPLWRGAQAVCRPPVAFLMLLAGGLFLGRRKLAAALPAAKTEGVQDEAGPTSPAPADEGHAGLVNSPRKKPESGGGS